MRALTTQRTQRLLCGVRIARRAAAFSAAVPTVDVYDLFFQGRRSAPFGDINRRSCSGRRLTVAIGCPTRHASRRGRPREPSFPTSAVPPRRDVSNPSRGKAATRRSVPHGATVSRQSRADPRLGHGRTSPSFLSVLRACLLARSTTRRRRSAVVRRRGPGAVSRSDCAGAIGARPLRRTTRFGVVNWVEEVRRACLAGSCPQPPG